MKTRHQHAGITSIENFIQRVPCTKVRAEQVPRKLKEAHFFLGRDLCSAVVFFQIRSNRTVKRRHCRRKLHKPTRAKAADHLYQAWIEPRAPGTPDLQRL